MAQKRCAVKSCSVAGCKGPAKARGLCWMHLGRYYRGGSPDLVPVIRIRPTPFRTAARYGPDERRAIAFLRRTYGLDDDSAAVRFALEVVARAEPGLPAARRRALAARARREAPGCELRTPARFWLRPVDVSRAAVVMLRWKLLFVNDALRYAVLAKAAAEGFR